MWAALAYALLGLFVGLPLLGIAVGKFIKARTSGRYRSSR